MYFWEKMVKRENIGSASIGVGAFLLALGILFFITTALDITKDQIWIVSWITNYVACGVGIIVGLILIGSGVYMRGALARYARKVERLSEAKVVQSQKLRQKSIALRETKTELGRKKTTLRRTKGKLKATEKLAEQKTEQMYSVRGKLGDRSKRLKQIEKLSKVKKKKK